MIADSNSSLTKYGLLLASFITFAPTENHAEDDQKTKNDSSAIANFAPSPFHLARFSSPNDASCEIGILNRASVSILFSSISIGWIELQSSINPATIYLLNANKLRVSALRSPISVGAIVLPFMLAFGSAEIGGYLDEHAPLIFFPAYTLNPEVNVSPMKQFKIYAGYSFDLIQDARIRQIYSVSAGAKLSLPRIKSTLKLGYESAKYKGEFTNSLVLGYIF